MKSFLTYIVLCSFAFSSYAYTFLPDSIISIDVVPDADTACIQLEMLGTSGYLLPNDTVIGQTGEWSTTSPNHIDFELYSTGQTIAIPDMINLLFPETYTLIWTETGAGFIAADTIQVTFAPRPTGEMNWPNNSETGCIGRHITLSVHVDYNLVEWQWDILNGVLFNPGPDSLNSLMIQVYWPNASFGDSHFVRLITKNSYGCNSPANVQVIHEPAPIDISPVIVFSTDNMANGEIWLNDPDNHPNEYQWIDTLGTTWANPSSDHQINLYSGQYFVQVSEENNFEQMTCVETFGLYTYSNTIEDDPDSNNTNDLSIYPNPACDNISIDLDIIQQGNYKIQIFNSEGKEVFTKDKYFINGIQSYELDINTLKSGKYIIAISHKQSQEGIIKGTFVKQL